MVVLITGANSGLGYELAKRLQGEGYTLILLVRKKSLKKIKRKFDRQYIVDIDFFTDNIQEKLKNSLPNIIPDVIIHAAGGKLEHDNHPIDIKILIKSFTLNLFSAIEINNFFIKKALLLNRYLRIIQVSSDAGITGRASPSYSISKGALNTYVKNIGRMYAKDNITICAVVPSIFVHKNSIWTKKKKKNPGYYKKIKNETTLKKFASVKEVADVIVDISKSKNMLYSAELINITAGNI